MSLQAQTHQDWRLWVRDDGSTDGTWQLLQELAAGDARIRVHPRDGRRLGPTSSHEWLWERLPQDVTHVFSCDADDVWLPRKMERSLEAMHTEEARAPGPVLVHTDLTVVDAELTPVAASFWAHVATDPEPTDLRRLLVANVATGPTLLLNRALLDRIRPIPAEAIYHDWWIALVASVFGRIVALREPTVLYRRHDANQTGRLVGPLRGLADVARRAGSARSRTGALRAWIDGSARQAGAFLAAYRDALTPDQVALLEDLSGLQRRSSLGRKLTVLRLHARPERGLLRNLGLVLRA